MSQADVCAWAQSRLRIATSFLQHTGVRAVHDPCAIVLPSDVTNKAEASITSGSTAACRRRYNSPPSLQIGSAPPTQIQRCRAYQALLDCLKRVANQGRAPTSRRFCRSPLCSRFSRHRRVGQQNTRHEVAWLNSYFTSLGMRMISPVPFPAPAQAWS